MTHSADSVSLGRDFEMANALTLGQRNNNPVNIKQFSNSDPWQGSSGYYGDKFVRFQTPELGWRAAYLNGINHISSNPNQSINEYIRSFSNTSNEKELAAYVKFVSQRLGVSPKTKLRNINDPYAFVDAQAELETRMTIEPNTRQRLQALLSNKLYK